MRYDQLWELVFGTQVREILACNGREGTLKDSNQHNRAIVTIATRDYFHLALGMLASAAKAEPNCRLKLYLIDRFPDNFEHPKSAFKTLENLSEQLEIVQIDQLEIENVERFFFQYTPFELACALKPFAIQHALENHHNVIYLDADIFVYQPLEVVWEYLLDSNFVVTPHINASDHERQEPDDRLETSLRWRTAGVFNAGFLAIRSGDEADKFLRWWRKICEKECYRDADRLADQAWLDQMPALFQGVHISQHNGLNVAYWNESFRDLVNQDGTPMVDNGNAPLLFFHFSGLTLSEPSQLSIYSDAEQSSCSFKLASEYAKRIQELQPQTYRKLESSLSTLSDGTPIEHFWREAIRLNLDEFQDVVDPWSVESNPNLVARFQTAATNMVWHRKEWTINYVEEELTRLYARVDELNQRRIGRKLKNVVSILKSKLRPAA